MVLLKASTDYNSWGTDAIDKTKAQVRSLAKYSVMSNFDLLSKCHSSKNVILLWSLQKRNQKRKIKDKE